MRVVGKFGCIFVSNYCGVYSVKTRMLCTYF